MNAVAIGSPVFPGERFLAVIAVPLFIGVTKTAAWHRPAQAKALRRWSLIAVLGRGIAARARAGATLVVLSKADIGKGTVPPGTPLPAPNQTTHQGETT